MKTRTLPYVLLFIFAGLLVACRRNASEVVADVPLAATTALPTHEADSLPIITMTATIGANDVDQATESAAAADIITSTPIVVPVAPTTAFNQAGYDARRTPFVPLDNPAAVTAAEATWLAPTDIVIGVEQNGAARAYPLSQMTYHHIANDTIGGQPYLVTY